MSRVYVDLIDTLVTCVEKTQNFDALTRYKDLVTGQRQGHKLR